MRSPITIGIELAEADAAAGMELDRRGFRDSCGYRAALLGLTEDEQELAEEAYFVHLRELEGFA